MPGRIGIAKLRCCKFASAGKQFRRVQSVAILSFLDLLLKFTRFVEGRKLGLLGLIEQAARLS